MGQAAQENPKTSVNTHKRLGLLRPHSKHPLQFPQTLDPRLLARLQLSSQRSCPLRAHVALILFFVESEAQAPLGEHGLAGKLLVLEEHVPAVFARRLHSVLWGEFLVFGARSFHF